VVPRRCDRRHWSDGGCHWRHRGKGRAIGGTGADAIGGTGLTADAIGGTGRAKGRAIGGTGSDAIGVRPWPVDAARSDRLG